MFARKKSGKPCGTSAGDDPLQPGSMKTIFNRWWRPLFFTLPIVLVPALWLAWWSGSEIASPPRRGLMDHHREFLTNQDAHGIRIDAFTASCGTPCLAVTPAGHPGERGRIIRRQLAERGLTVPPFGQITGTLVLTHGRKGRKEDYLPIAERLCAAGFRCVIPDLPGHGDHPQAIATYGLREATLPARVLEEAARKFRFEKQPAGLMGMSMGGSVAVHAASRESAPWKALVVIASFDSFPAVIHGQAARYSGITLGSLWADASETVYRLKTGVSLRDIQPAKHAASLRIPTLIAHGTADRVIPLESGRRLFDAIPASAPKKWEEIPDAGHDNVLVTSHPVYADIAEWMIRNVADEFAP
jgi:pimeloyl-ACP methyl ester carboxylesterase